MTPFVSAVLPAAGKGERAHLGYNKILYSQGEKCVLTQTLEALANAYPFGEYVLAVSPEEEECIRETLERELSQHLPIQYVHGGTSRTQSVGNALKAVSEKAEIIAVHDAARPFVPQDVVQKTIESAMQFGSGIASSVVTDTIKITDDAGNAVSTPERSHLRAVQTPQTFRREIILPAYAMAEKDNVTASDDAALVEKYIGKVRLIETESSAKNIKLTWKEDFAVQAQIPRTGFGYDAHKLVEDRELVLCGVSIPYEKGLLGHSDADVATHALIDALLGAACLGDIGQLFPDIDDAYKGICSLRLLERTRDCLSEHGHRVAHADITIIAQRPKMAPFIPQMRMNIAQTLHIAQECVSIKATTTEKMGFEGRGEGISACAVATII